MEQDYPPRSIAHRPCCAAPATNPLIGTPDYVAEKITDIRDTLGLDRFTPAHQR